MEFSSVVFFKIETVKLYGERAQSVKCPVVFQDLGSSPRAHVTKLGMAVPACSTFARGLDTGRSLGLPSWTA